MNKFKSRKFHLTIASLTMASIFLFISKINGDQWVMVVIAILGMYKYANIQENKNVPHQ